MKRTLQTLEIELQSLLAMVSKRKKRFVSEVKEKIERVFLPRDITYFCFYPLMTVL